MVGAVGHPAHEAAVDVDAATTAPYVVAAVRSASTADVACVPTGEPHTQLVYAVPADGADQSDSKVDALRQSTYEASAVIDNAAVRNSYDDSVLNVDVTNLTRTGSEDVKFGGTFDAFTTLIALRDGPYRLLPAEVTAVCNQIRPHVAADPNAVGTIGQMDADCQQIKDGIAARIMYIRSVLGR